ncbi:MAG: ABC transporter permease [Candidatus Marinimicrobia bacterium]|nr:ABC transporter permease [Candidatus Neomarinimicrobiota bacterium]
MIRFLIKGVLRDRSRSLFSVIAITIGVFLAVVYRGFVAGIFDDMLRQGAIMMTGHVKVTTRAYAEEAALLPTDLALLGVEETMEQLSADYPGMFFTPRIVFGGLIDVPDEEGVTREQGPIAAMAIDMLSPGSRQVELWDLENRLVQGRLPRLVNEALLGAVYAKRLLVGPGDIITLIGSTMHGAFTTHNFTIVGTVAIGVGNLGKNLLLTDISGARLALDMEDGATEILGFYNDMFYDDDAAVARAADYNAAREGMGDEFSPHMVPLRDQYNMGAMIDIMDVAVAIFIGVFFIVITIVLWNLGIMNSMRRYGELGVRLAMGESKRHVFGSLVIESTVVGIGGWIAGTVLGLAVVYYLQEVGIDYGAMMDDFNMPISHVMRGKITPDSFYLGLFPGVVAPVVGTMLAGRAIFKREMSQLFKELET